MLSSPRDPGQAEGEELQAPGPVRAGARERTPSAKIPAHPDRGAAERDP
jgi:hypothetical protein